MSQPAIAAVLLNLVIVCNCDKKVVLVVPSNGHVECPACRQKWRLDHLKYDVLPATSEIVLDVRVGPASLIAVPGLISS